MGAAAAAGITKAVDNSSAPQLQELLASMPQASNQKLASSLESVMMTTQRCEGMSDKEEFVRFVLNAARSQATPEYRQLYSFLLSCFTEADTDFDGLVGPDDFDIMVERAGSLPRKFGFAPTAREAFPTTEARRQARAAMFAKMDTSKDGKIAFDEWLGFCYSHICEKAKLLNPEGVEWKLGTFGAEGFIKFLDEACRSKETIEYKELYRWLLACFANADEDHDGKIIPAEFDALIEWAAQEPRRLGFAPSTSATYKSESEKSSGRKKMFDMMDTAKSGFVGFQEFLDFTYKHICEKVRALPRTQAPPSPSADFSPKELPLGPPQGKLPRDKQEFVAFVLNATRSKTSSEFHELYKFLLQCFTEADTDFDGLVGPDDFDVMVERAGNLPRQFGFAPTAPEAFPTAEARRAARTEMFRKMDTSSDQKISFDEWFQFAYVHICEKAKLLPESVEWRLGTFGADGFVAFLREACRSKQTMEYKELYRWLLQCFTLADSDVDGKIIQCEFDALIDNAAEEPRRLGFAPSSSATYKSDAERRKARKKMFESMDKANTGFIAFDEFLTFTYKHICEKVSTIR